jgi:hypothetical protein
MDEQLMLDPASRRRWLLRKALETAPLGEALALAQAAEGFISGMVVRTSDRTSSEVMKAPAVGTGAGLEGEAIQLMSLNAVTVSNDQPPFKNDQPLTTTEALEGLSSLVSLDDVIRYLQEGGDLAGDESADNLLSRANLRRLEQRLPPFALLPTPSIEAIRQDKPKKVLPRPTSARARAEWARSVVALSAE